jgi:transcriptional regulator with XRE-family HTH domain
MNAATPKGFRGTHFLAAELHRVMGRRGWTIARLARECGESESFIKDILLGEDSVDRRVNFRFLQAVANASRITLNCKVPPEPNVKNCNNVKSGDAS